MNNRTWNDADLYAYLDEEMNAERSEALESDLANNEALRQRLDKLRLTLAFVKEVPLQEEPRNYILTPSMVEEPEPEPEPATQRRPLLLVMRLATTLSALAFVVMVGLQINMSLAPQPAALPQEEALLLEREQPVEENAAAVEEEAEVMEAPQEAAEEETAAATPTAAAEMAAVEEAERESEEKTGGTAPTWDEGEGGAAEGLGGGGAPLEPEIEEAPPEEDVGICGVGDTSEECAGDVEEAPEVLAEEATGSEVEPVPTVVAEETEDATSAETVPARSRPTWQLWLAIAFGLSTVVLGITTWWLTRRR